MRLWAEIVCKCASAKYGHVKNVVLTGYYPHTNFNTYPGMYYRGAYKTSQKPVITGFLLMPQNGRQKSRKIDPLVCCCP
jgi:hypothetical protein